MLTSDRKRLTFELFRKSYSGSASDPQYIAVGFNRDTPKMYPAAVTACIGEPGTGKTAVWLAFNPGHFDEIVANTSVQIIMRNTTEGGFLDGTLICRYVQEIYPPDKLNNSHVYSLNASYYWIMARGFAQGIGIRR